MKLHIRTKPILSFPRKRESMSYADFPDSRFRGNDIEVSSECSCRKPPGHEDSFSFKPHSGGACSARYQNEKGIVLITTLMLMVLGLSLVVTILWLVNYGSKLSGMEGRYITALEASKGGSEFIVDMIRNGITTPPNAMGNALGPSTANCLQAKMTQVGAACAGAPCNPWGASCGANSGSSDPTVEPDVTLTLSNYNVFIKIVDTRQDTDATGNITNIYTINVRSVAPNIKDNAEISFLLQY